MVRCALCGFEFDERALMCHAACPLAEGCAIICCPNCGYQFVDEEKSSLAGWLRRWAAGRRAATAAPLPQAQSLMGIGLDALQPGQAAEVVQIASNDASRLMQLSALGVAPGSAVALEQRFPAYILRVGETQLSLDGEVARQIRVQPRAGTPAGD